MANVPVEKYAPRNTIEGQEIGLNYPNETAAYMVGQRLRGMRVSGLDSLSGSAIIEGQDYKVSGPVRHNEVFDDFLGPVLSTARWGTKAGSDGANAVAIASGLGGVARATTGGGSAHTVAVNGIVLQSDLNFKAGNTGLVFEARVGNVSSLTGLVLFMGFTDQIAALEMPATLATATLTTNASDAVGFLFDAAQTTPHLNLVGVKGDTDATTQNLTVDPATSGYHTYRIEIDSSENAKFFIDGLQVGTVMASALTKTVALTPVIGVSSESTAARTVDIDYVIVQQLRV